MTDAMTITSSIWLCEGRHHRQLVSIGAFGGAVGIVTSGGCAAIPFGPATTTASVGALGARRRLPCCAVGGASGACTLPYILSLCTCVHHRHLGPIARRRSHLTGWSHPRRSRATPLHTRAPRDKSSP